MIKKNYFIFVFNESKYEDKRRLGKIFKFPELDRGGYKFEGKSVGSWGHIIGNVRKDDEVIWTISGGSRRRDKKTFWGYGKITDIDMANKLWKTESTEFQKKIKIDEVIKIFPENYKKLYVLSNGNINLGYYGTIQIDKYQYDFIRNFFTGFEKWICPKESCNHKIILNRNKDNVIDPSSYEKVIKHFLQHLKKSNVYFGVIDIQKIFLENTPKNILSFEELEQYKNNDKIWINQIRYALEELNHKGYLETDMKSDIPEFYNRNIDNKRDFRTRKRSQKFFKELNISNNWELYKTSKV